MKLKVSSRKNKDGSEYYEGSVTFPISNLGSSKVQKADGTSKFSTRSAVVQAANNVAKKLGYDISEDQPVKKAAKKSTSSSKTNKSSTSSSTCSNKNNCGSTCNNKSSNWVNN